MEPPGSEQSNPTTINVSIDGTSSSRSSASLTRRELRAEHAEQAEQIDNRPSRASVRQDQQQQPQPGQTSRLQYQHPSLRASPSPSRSHSRKISASSIAASITGRKSRYVDSTSSETHSEPSTLPTASQPTPIPVKSTRSRHSRTQSGISDAGSDVLVFGEPHPSPTHSDILRIRAGLNAENATYAWLPEPALTAQSSLSDFQSRRLSSTSIYSLASARGIINYSSSAHGSDSGAPPRSVSGLMSSTKGGSAGTPPEPGVSNVTVTTSSSNGSNANGQHNLTARDPHSQPLDLMRRSQRADNTMRTQPDRSRSRAKRRFSGSTATSTHSQGSDRGNHRDREEGNASPNSPYLLILICVLTMH